ncbi:hypothetical protein ETW23_07815 [Leisingera sp. NJS201]|uniref:hypothetical protein n=1 Tax=Leisingera sp. NJS201 TaxID=2508306 RepID=UPI001070CF8A|nr:hypothetical protein [Leisingera sp. NJS201]QBR36060.1 hypothetical protein ETW23_07815 [Leisingera sp. NJS201]
MTLSRNELSVIEGDARVISQSRTPASSGLAQLPGSHGDALPGPFYSRLPLAGTGPSLASFLAGWDQRARELWPRPADLAGEVIGAACAFALPFLFLFGAFLK